MVSRPVIVDDDSSSSCSSSSSSSSEDCDGSEEEEEDVEESGSDSDNDSEGEGQGQGEHDGACGTMDGDSSVEGSDGDVADDDRTTMTSACANASPPPVQPAGQATDSAEGGLLVRVGRD